MLVVMNWPIHNLKTCFAMNQSHKKTKLTALDFLQKHDVARF